MKRRCTRAVAAIWVLAMFLSLGAARAEVVEEIVAWVNGEIIAKSEMDQEEKMILGEAYRRYTGAELDEQVRKVRETLLERIVDRKLLIQKAARLYDVQKMGEGLLDEFKDSQNIKTDDELRRALAQEGMTLDELKRRLIEMYAPEQIIRFEVIGRLAVSDREIQEYYDAHPELSEVPARATVREIVLLAEPDAKERRRAEAEQVRDRAAKPDADFAAIAMEVSESGSKSSGGLLGTVAKGDLAPEIEAAAFGTPVGQVGPLIEMPHGYHIIKVDDRAEARRKPVTEIKEDVRKAIEQSKYSDALAAYLEKARAESEVVVKESYKNRLPWAKSE
jgi:parvulin-like peptidyl-prolyl isomerase